jgi:hypothetical protein
MVYQYQARCECGATWRVYLTTQTEDPMATCVACGADTYDLTEEGEERANW